MSTAGLVLAAGGSARFGALPKQLADLHGRPLLQWALDAQTGVDVTLLDPIVVVLGADAAAIRAAISLGRARVVDCPRWSEGQSASLRAGLAALRELGADGEVLVTLGDAPLVSPAVIARVAGLPAPARATYHGRPGHPVLLGAAERAALARRGGDEGARGLLRDARTVEVGDLCSDRDVDTPRDLEEVRDEARAVV